MSVSTNVYLVKQHEIDQFMIEVVKALKSKFEKNYIEDSLNIRDCNNGKITNYEFKDLCFALDYETENFTDKKEHRSISVFYHPDQEMRRDYYELHFNVWGHNKEIANCLVDYFGGWADYSDCDNIEIDYCKSQLQSFLGVKS